MERLATFTLGRLSYFGRTGITSDPVLVIGSEAPY